MSTTAHDGPPVAGRGRVRRPSDGPAAPPEARGLARHLPVLARFESPVTTYYLLVVATLALLVIGLVMVLSASSVTSLKTTGSSFSTFRNQLLFAALGLPLMVLAARMPVRLWQRLGWPLVLVSLVAQLAVFSPLGVEVNGNRNWVQLGAMRLQPSEALKLALVVWGASVLCRKRALLDRWSHVLVPLLVPVGAAALGLVLLGHDLGTSLVLLMVLGSLLFAAGVPARMFLTAGLGFAGLVAVFVVTSPNRMGRLGTWMHCTDSLGACMQPIHGKYALADGGFWGVGLGASREKWSWLPEAHNDFIFAIIGEELGLPGTLVVLALFVALGYACLRLVTRADDLFVRIATAAGMTWLLGQMLVNVGAVIGLLPVVGVPLPLVSSGGSALVVTMVLLGMLMSFARHEPGCRDALAARPSLVRRSLAVLPARTRVAGRRGRAGS